MITGLATYPPVTPDPAAAGDHKDIDVMSVDDMILLDGQAVQLADTIAAKTRNAKVKALAARIKAARTPQITAMAGWPKGWGPLCRTPTRRRWPV